MSNKSDWLTRHLERPISALERQWLIARFSREELSRLGGWILFLSQSIAWLGFPVGLAVFLTGREDFLAPVVILTYGIAFSGIYVAARISKIITQMDTQAARAAVS